MNWNDIMGSVVVETAINEFYSWLGIYNVSLAFIVFSMYLGALYMIYRNLRRLHFLGLMALLVQLMLTAMGTLTVLERVMVIPAYEVLFIVGGIFLPIVFLMRDYAGMKRRARIAGGPVPLVIKPQRRPAIVVDRDWIQQLDAPGILYAAALVGANIDSPDAAILEKAREQLQEAENHILDQRLDEAEEIYAFLTRLIPLDAMGLCNAGWLKLEAGDPDEALRLFRRASGLARKETVKKKGGVAKRKQKGISDPGWFARCGIACTHFRLQAYEEALFAFQKASLQGGESASLLRNMARCHLLLNCPDQAREELERALELQEDPDTRLALARLFNELSLREGVVAQLDHLTATSREMPEPWRMLGTLYRREENWVEAEPCFARLVRLEPEDADAWFRLGTCRRHLDQRDEALSAFRSAVRLQPNHSRALFGAAAILEERDDTVEAISLLKQSLAGNEPTEKAWNLLAVAYRKEGRIREAVAAYEEAVSAFPESALLHANLGAAQVVAGFPERAVKPLKTAVRHGENDVSVYTMWVNALLETKHLHEAVRVLKEAVGVHPGHAGLHYLSARAKARVHDTDGAIVALETAVGIDPGLRLDARACGDFSSIRTAPGFIDLIRLPTRQA